MQQRVVKLVVFGDGGVGKSSIVIRQIQGFFITEYDPTIEDSYRKQMDVGGEQVLIDILDTAGNEEYSLMIDQWRREGEGFIIVYSITARYSFDSVNNIYEQILRIKDVDDDTYVPIIIVGNKIDLEEERQITAEEGEQLADSLGVDFLECSAKEGINIEEIFETITLDVIGNLPRKLPKSTVRKRGCMLC